MLKSYVYYRVVLNPTDNVNFEINIPTIFYSVGSAAECLDFCRSNFRIDGKIEKVTNQEVDYAVEC